MPNIQSAKKRVRVTAVKTLRNKKIKSGLKTEIKKFDTAVTQGADNKTDLFRSATGAVDKARIKGVVHKNKANRKKAQLARKLREAAQ